METARTFTTGDGAHIAYRLARPGAAPERGAVPCADAQGATAAADAAPAASKSGVGIPLAAATPPPAAGPPPLRAGAPRRTLVLIHGLASNLTRWSEFAAATRLADTWDILRLDLRGHGGSLHRGRVGMPVWCDDLAALLRAEGVPRAVLAGHCLGANLALWFARREPERVAGLVLIEPMFRRALAGTLAHVAALRPLLAALVPPLTALAALGLHRRHLAPLDLAELDHAARAAMAAAGGAFPQARYASPWEDLRSLPTSVYLQDLVAVTGPLPELAAIRAPALALLSTGGTFSDPETTERLLAPLPDCRIVRIAAQHWIPTEQPQAMREAIEAWCDALEARGAA